MTYHEASIKSLPVIKGKNCHHICRSILDSFNGGMNLNNFINNISNKDCATFQNILLSVANNKNEVEYIITLKYVPIPI